MASGGADTSSMGESQPHLQKVVKGSQIADLVVAIPGLLIQTLHLRVSGKCAALHMTFFLSPLMPLGSTYLVHRGGEQRKEKPYLKKQNCNHCSNTCLEVNSIIFPRHVD